MVAGAKERFEIVRRRHRNRLGRLYLKAVIVWSVAVLFAVVSLWIFAGPIFDWLVPWPEAVSALNRQESHAFRLLVGFEKTSHTGALGQPDREHRERSYVLLPNVFREPDVYSYSEETGGAGELKRWPYGAITYMLMDLVTLAVAWFFSLPRFRRIIRTLNDRPQKPVRPA